MRAFLRKAAVPVGAAAGLIAAYLVYDDHKSNQRHNTRPGTKHTAQPAAPTPLPPSRGEIVARLSQPPENNVYDMLIIGGGATGTGVAFDAVSRGLKVALVEADDFASATSSRSTKLIHGGVRYLEKAFWQADYGQYKLVREALAERKNFIDMAPHLTFALPIMIPIYKWWQLPYFYAGVKAYDALAGRSNLESGYMLSRTKALEMLPMLDDHELKGAIVYYDGMHNDARTNVSLALTAIDRGADVLNHAQVTSLVKDNGKVGGARIKDLMDGSEFEVRAKCVVNATGPFTDSIRTMADEKAEPIAIASSGVHIVLPGYYCPQNMGLLDPATSDGRVIFFLPWQGSTLAGTTDRSCKIEINPRPSEEDIEFVLNEVSRYIEHKLEISRADVRAAWAGIRPLVRDPADPKSGSTENVVRSHIVDVGPSGLVTIAGGKWTTFREMAEETVDRCVSEFGIKPRSPCRTAAGRCKLVGAEGWNPLMYTDLLRQFSMDAEVAKHLSENYGTRAWDVARLCAPSALNADGTVAHRNERLAQGYPFMDGEVHYAVRYEYATKVMDVLARRTRLAFLDARVCLDTLPKVVGIMAADLGWNEDRQRREYLEGKEYLLSMGLLNDEAIMEHGLQAPVAK